MKSAEALNLKDTLPYFGNNFKNILIMSVTCLMKLSPLIQNGFRNGYLTFNSSALCGHEKMDIFF